MSVASVSVYLLYDEQNIMCMKFCLNGTTNTNT